MYAWIAEEGHAGSKLGACGSSRQPRSTIEFVVTGLRPRRTERAHHRQRQRSPGRRSRRLRCRFGSEALHIAASTFSIFAFEALRKELERVEELEFVFTSPSFVAAAVYRQAHQGTPPVLHPAGIERGVVALAGF